ncbi:hypothetical protein SAMN05216327_105243 [Dyadobacter sp. SG02]|nr:hypothetical protein SAMN05216327_105243 [Dyadobacter sp. SG02]
MTIHANKNTVGATSALAVSHITLILEIVAMKLPLPARNTRLPNHEEKSII